jgi:hypothetical protein
VSVAAHRGSTLADDPGHMVSVSIFDAELMAGLVLIFCLWMKDEYK